MLSCNSAAASAPRQYIQRCDHSAKCFRKIGIERFTSQPYIYKHLQQLDFYLSKQNTFIFLALIYTSKLLGTVFGNETVERQQCALSITSTISSLMLISIPSQSFQTTLNSWSRVQLAQQISNYVLQCASAWPAIHSRFFRQWLYAHDKFHDLKNWRRKLWIYRKIFRVFFN